MKLHFEPNLDFQLQAIEAVCDLFGGQEVCRTEFTVTRDSAEPSAVSSIAAICSGVRPCSSRAFDVHRKPRRPGSTTGLCPGGIVAGACVLSDGFQEDLKKDCEYAKHNGDRTEF